MIALKTLLSALLVASAAHAQLEYTTTYPWANGDTVVVEVSTNPLNGLATTVVLSTVSNGLGVTGVTTSRTTTTTPLGGVTNTRTRTTTTPTTTQRVVGQETTYPPMQTTTYGYPGPDGVWTSATWTATNTGDPTVVTAIVPAGTIQDYAAYQSQINAVLYSSAVAAEAVVNANGTVSISSASARTPIGRSSIAIGLAAVGAVIGALVV